MGHFEQLNDRERTTAAARRVIEATETAIERAEQMVHADDELNNCNADHSIDLQALQQLMALRDVLKRSDTGTLDGIDKKLAALMANAINDIASDLLDGIEYEDQETLGWI